MFKTGKNEKKRTLVVIWGYISVVTMVFYEVPSLVVLLPAVLQYCA